MKYLIAKLLLTGLVYSQDCNEINWEKYYNSKGRNMRGCDLTDANLEKANLTGAYLEGANLEGENLEEVLSGYIKGVPISLPKGWALVDGVLVSKKKTK